MHYCLKLFVIVAPFVGAWVEISKNALKPSSTGVAPFVGAWVEMPRSSTRRSFRWPSLPLWERGLKYLLSRRSKNGKKSLPLWERGLKFVIQLEIRFELTVAPFVGAWVEIQVSFSFFVVKASLPLWERGLKSLRLWAYYGKIACRSLCGSVG